MNERVDRAVARAGAELDHALREKFDFGAGLAAIEAEGRRDEREEDEGELLYLPAAASNDPEPDPKVHLDTFKDFIRRTFEHSQDRAISTWNQLMWKTELRQAIDDRQVDILYQPAVDPQSGRFSGVSVVGEVKTFHGSLSGDELARRAARVGRASTLYLLVIQRAVAELREREQSLARNITVEVGCPRHWSADFGTQLQGVLTRSGVPTQALTLSVPEREMVEPSCQEARPVMQAVRQLGVSLAIREFSGASLPQLHRLPVNRVRLRSDLVEAMADSRGSFAVIHTLLKSARALGLRTEADGVRSQLAYDLLANLDCDEVRGSAIADPLLLREFESWLVVRAGVDAWPGHAAQPSPLLRLWRGEEDVPIYKGMLEDACRDRVSEFVGDSERNTDPRERTERDGEAAVSC